MNKTSFLQTDGKWGGLVYPKKPCYIRNVGCGEVSIANVLIEMEQYKRYTPATIQPYCKRYGAPNCDGTYLSGICAMMKHYGMTNVKECATMADLWKELEKGDRVAIYLMGNRKAGSKGIVWTSGGHFIASVGYEYKDKKHHLYIKDPGSSARNHNGWLTYEEHLKNDVIAVYVGKLVQKKATEVGKLTVDGIGGTETIKATQKYFGTAQDGIISGQMKKLAQYYPSIESVEFGKSGSAVVKALQKWLGLTQDGIIGQGTTAAWQKKLRDLGYLAKSEKIDGIFGVKSMKAWQKFLNAELFTDKKTEDKTEDKKDETPTTELKPPYKVIDVSDWQGKIDWTKVKADGVVGAIIRYADGTTLDKRFDENMKNAKKAGLHIGSYIFSRAKTKAEAETEAQRLYDACKPYEPDMPLYIDLEVSSLSKYANTVAKAFLAKMKKLGGKGGVYANLNWWNNYLKETAKGSFAMWVAQYNTTLDYKPKTDVGMWQYGSSGSVNGISGRVDMDECYVAYWDASVGASEPHTDEKTDESTNYPTWVKKANKWAEALAKDAKAGYRKFNSKDKSTYECLLCHPETDPGGKWYVKTGNCIWFSFAYLHHGGGLPCNCSCHVLDDAFMTKLLTMDEKTALKQLKKKIGLDDLSLIRNNGKTIAKKNMKAGDLCITYDSKDKATHIYPYIGDGKMIDCGNWKDKAKQIAKRTASPCKAIIRYNGK